jgi:hypothetical protein
MGGACRTQKSEDKCITISVGIPDGTSPLGRFRRGWDDNIRMDLKEM